MRSKFKVFSKNKMDELYLTKSMITEWIQTLDELWDELDKPQSGDFDFWPQWVFNITMNQI